MNIQVSPHTITLQINTDINAGEYNITPCEFSFSEEYDGLAKEAIFSNCSTAIKVPILNNQCVIPNEVLQNEGNVLLGVFAYETDNEELVLRYSPNPQYFNVKKGSYQEGNDPDLPSPSIWEQVLEQINESIEETNNLNITADKEGHIATITITKKDGTEQTVNIEDGKSLEFNWEGTSLGVRVEGQSQYEYTNLKGDPGVPGAVKFIIVETLPTENIDTSALYLVPKQSPTQTDLYDEYMYVDNKWELLGEKQIAVDLTDYVKNTDYATSGKGGVVKVGYFGMSIDSGRPYATEISYSTYNNSSTSKYTFIGKGTLENVLTGKGFITNTVNNLTNYTTTTDMNTLLGNKLDSSKVVNANSTTAGETYDVRYINSLVGDVENILEELDIGGGISG